MTDLQRIPGPPWQGTLLYNQNDGPPQHPNLKTKLMNEEIGREIEGVKTDIVRVRLQTTEHQWAHILGAYLRKAHILGLANCSPEGMHSGSRHSGGLRSGNLRFRAMDSTGPTDQP